MHCFVISITYKYTFGTNKLMCSRYKQLVVCHRVCLTCSTNTQSYVGYTHCLDKGCDVFNWVRCNSDGRYRGFNNSEYIVFGEAFFLLGFYIYVNCDSLRLFLFIYLFRTFFGGVINCIVALIFYYQIKSS